MSHWLTFDPSGDLKLVGIRLVGASAATAKKLLFTLILVAVVVGLNFLLRALSRLLIAGRENERVRFWTRQGIRLAVALLFLFGIVSIWFAEPTRLGTFLGLVTAGVAFALQRVLTALDAAGIGIASATYDIVGMPPLRIEQPPVT